MTPQSGKKYNLADPFSAEDYAESFRKFIEDMKFLEGCEIKDQAFKGQQGLKQLQSGGKIELRAKFEGENEKALLERLKKHWEDARSTFSSRYAERNLVSNVDLFELKEYKSALQFLDEKVASLGKRLAKLPAEEPAQPVGETLAGAESRILTPELTKEQHAEILGYGSGKSAARALGGAWKAGVPSQGIRRALSPEKLLSPVKKFRTGRAVSEKWRVPETTNEILDMYANPDAWKGKKVSVRLKG